MLGGPPPVRLRAWDGSLAGPAGAPVVHLRSRRALRRLLWQPDELGLAQAYISGELEIEGDLTEALRTVWQAARDTGMRPPKAGLADRARAAAVLLKLGAVGPRPPQPSAPAARLGGRLHSRSRDRAAISHHYDLSNDFYELLLDPSMAYSCGVWTRPDDPEYGLADAQHDKLEIICRKLALRPGARHLDIGCGWGSLTLHAAEHFKARVTAVTLARRQAEFVRARVKQRGLEDRVEVRLCDYRDIDGGGYDAVSTIEMGEHVGDAEYPAFARTLHGKLRPGGRVLVQQMSRGSHAPGGGAFIESYIAPDMHMRPLGRTLALLEDAGLEVRHTESVREHYVRTIRAWHDTLEERWSTFTGLVGEHTARVWRLYLVGGALAFEERRMGVDQLLAVRPTAEGDAEMPSTPRAWYAAEGLR
ncbi:cyclopropane-fatty-acyl-phospholipid synthase family protein [Streptomyces sp. DSM 42041]|uniref:Cyclopropane-fatty-acyl-phospholipid synthase family protein n=1 Tax=Streptomyces hazeniae TaxID=3075538 RepID=A0ABU2NTQ8_9ACTN|nr:cyclopropane-fatty-acyl-phospholipid synthase family protein [Streptomyces sp. DSM 42041]MDT0380110.1 cyclopropane-fatty-acyl-phospholipid synthase family protein [Streptomyces sp. DSM 42041]